MALDGVKGTLLERVFLSVDRHPSYRVVIWNPRSDTVQDVVLDRWTGMSYEISQWVSRVKVSQNQVFENSEDSVSSFAEIEVVWDEENPIGPNGIPITEKIFQDGTPIRVYEGDRRVDPNDWIPVFTGSIRGAASAEVAKRGERKISFSAFGRAQAFQTQNIVGLSFDYDTDLGDAAKQLAMSEMALEPEEIRFGRFGFQTKHKANTLTQIPKVQGLWELMRPVSRKPYFNARGELVSHVTTFDRSPVYVFDKSPVVVSVIRDQFLGNTTNSYSVTGLDYRLTEIVSSVQKLGDVTVTTGYFDSGYRKEFFFSDDRRRRVKDSFIVVDEKPPFGSDADWEQIDEFHGKLTLDTGYAPWVAGLAATIWASLAVLEAILDGIEDPSGFVKVVLFITRMTMAAYMLLLLQTMQLLGRWEIEIHGKPFENVYQEIRSIAALKGVPTADQIEQEATIHWLSDIDSVASMAKDLLKRELVKSHSYTITMMSNPIIEVDDIVAIRDEANGLPNFSYFYVNSIDRQYQRGPLTDVMTLRAWHIKESESLL